MYQVGTAGSHGLGTTDRTCLLGIRRGLQNLTGSKHQIERAYYVSGRCCIISWARNTRSYMPTMYQVGAAGSHGLGTTDRTCLLGIRRWLQDPTGSKHQIERAYEVSERCCIISRARNTRSYMPARYPEDLTGSTNKIVHGYIVLGRGCRISRVWNNRFNMPSRYKDGAARSHGFRTPDNTCLERIRTGLQDLTGKEHQIEPAYKVSGRGYRISRVGNIVHAY